MGAAHFDAGDLWLVRFSPRLRRRMEERGRAEPFSEAPGSPGGARIAVHVGALRGGRDDADLVILARASLTSCKLPQAAR